MSRRTVAILLGVFVVLLGLVLLGERDDSAPAGSGAPLIAGLTEALGDMERVTVTKANGEIVATLESGPTTGSSAARTTTSPMPASCARH